MLNNIFYLMKYMRIHQKAPAASSTLKAFTKADSVIFAPLGAKG